jgi:hypothetical protein
MKKDLATPKTKVMRVADLKLHPDNPREMPEDRMESLKHYMQKVGMYGRTGS